MMKFLENVVPKDEVEFVFESGLNDLSARPNTLLFLKAKVFGAHTPMYYLPLYQQTGAGRWQPDTSRLAGRRITFIWEKD